MSESPNRLSGHGGEEDVMDRATAEAIDRLIYSVLAQSARRSSPGDVGQGSGLTDDDRAALETLGTSEELARRVVARFEKSDAVRIPKPGSTFVHDRGALETVPNGPAETADVRPEQPQFADLLARHAACCETEHFQWDYRFVKEEQEIGQGGQGVVYRVKCEDDFVGSRALKILSPEPYHDAQSYCLDMERMRAVAATVHQNYHDNVIHVERFEPHNGIYVMVMRLIDGFDLERLLQHDVVERLRQWATESRWAKLKKTVFADSGHGRWALTPGVAVNIVEKCLRGLHALHEKGIGHCDVRPSNIMLDRHGSIRIIDIGSALRYESRPRWHAWTPRYAPPEVLEDGAWTPQSDLASLGYVLVELLSGQSDFLAPSASLDSVHAPLDALNREADHTLDRTTRSELAEVKRQLPDQLGRLIPAPARQSKDLLDLCKALIHPDPARRFASAEEAIDYTAKFKDSLVVARLGMLWVKEIKFWVTDTMNAMSDTSSNG